MNKKRTINELTNLLAVSLRHRIGSIVDYNEIYAQKYSKDSEILLREAKKIALSRNWNMNDKSEIKRILRIKLEDELRKKEFLDDRKFEIMDEEIDKVLRELELV